MCAKSFGRFSTLKSHKLACGLKTEPKPEEITPKSKLPENACRTCEENPLKLPEMSKIAISTKTQILKNSVKIKAKTEEQTFKMPIKFECTVCERVFLSEQKLKKHKIVHKECPFCQKIFDKRWHLYDHEETEHGVKKFEHCQVQNCVAKFTTKEYLKQHAKREHQLDLACLCNTVDFAQVMVMHWQEMTASAIPDPEIIISPPVYQNQGVQNCGECSYKTENLNDLEKHLYSAHKDQIWIE